VYSEPENKIQLKLLKTQSNMQGNGFNVVIVDTAGRLAVDEEMMNEIGRS
jgi:signal recognition particle subunit SRP54